MKELTAAVDHDARNLASFLKPLSSCLDMLLAIVGSTGTTSEDNMAVRVTSGFDDSC